MTCKVLGPLTMAIAMLATSCVRAGFQRQASELQDGSQSIDGADSRPDAMPTDAHGADLDASPVDVASADAGLPAFGAPAIIAELAAPGNDDDPSLTGDRLELFFNSDRSGSRDIWVSVRAATTDPWGAPVRVDSLNSSGIDSSPEIAVNGLTIWFSSKRAGGPGADNIWRSTRPNRSGPWSTPVLVDELNSTSRETSAAPDATLLWMVLGSTRPGGLGARDLYLSSRPSATASWGIPVHLAQLNSPQLDAHGMLVSNARWLYFDSRRDTVAGDQIFVAFRTDVSSPFGAPAAIAELNSSANDQDPWVSEDQRNIVFSSDRSGDFEIYEASR